jgi:hypothetical protein
MARTRLVLLTALVVYCGAHSKKPGGVITVRHTLSSRIALR